MPGRSASVSDVSTAVDALLVRISRRIAGISDTATPAEIVNIVEDILMAAGIILGPGDVNQMVGGTARDLNNIMLRVQAVQSVLVTIGSAGLQAAPFNFSSGDSANILSAMGDMDFLRQVYQGAAAESPTHSGAYDFRTFAKLLWGWGV